ncbi:nucleotide disphospho-sugar-binding domain-containing protein [Actinoallomurus iriomotensis]|uniref:Glycosyl transferase n=1 Tax=Actinoallomurus iriomotensis TaxID=478107 RepID=A0A9W6S4B2_9ACTN|nr:nucleotide disphospho-sugar-binding domain-containing protein [Actinoallomurus iriomotensis]GLY85135.1 glycosyl transferase [Actinoallomurus iriomotensis]
MRIIFTTWAWPSHLYAMVPVAWACRTRGHEVLVASQPALADTAARTGLPVASVGHDVDAVAVFRQIASSPSPSAGGPRPKRGGPRVLGLLATLAEAMVDDLIVLARRWGADLIVFEPTAFAGPAAAAVLGIPAVRHLYGVDLMSAAGDFLGDALAPLRTRLGLDEIDVYGAATVDPCPDGMQAEAPSPRLPVRYVPYNGPGAPPVLPPPDGRPRVCVTWGTTLSRLDPAFFLTGQVARAIGDLDVEPVLAVTPGQRTLLGPFPPGTRVVESAPLHLLLPTCDAVVAHGGAGTSLTGVAYGLPQLLVTRLPDHVRHAAGLARAGAGITVEAAKAEPRVIRERLAELLSDPSYRAAAERLSRETHDRPSPDRVVTDIERLVSAVR